ncbi:MAG TPA: cupin domain-containing protein [Steroidobacteraceae bacterium]|jgi:quercetin dioxygenase-like cupin family protein
MSIRSLQGSSEILPWALIESFAMALNPIELIDQRREALRRQALRRARDATIDGTATLRAENTPWVDCAPFIQMKVLRRDQAAGYQTVLIRMQPGGVLPAHRHKKEEEFIVLQGECHIGTHRLAAGDAHLAAVGSWHAPVTTQTGVVVLLRGEYPAPVHGHAAEV